MIRTKGSKTRAETNLSQNVETSSNRESGDSGTHHGEQDYRPQVGEEVTLGVTWRQLQSIVLVFRSMLKTRTLVELTWRRKLGLYPKLFSCKRSKKKIELNLVKRVARFKNNRRKHDQEEDCRIELLWFFDLPNVVVVKDLEQSSYYRAWKRAT